MWCCVYLSSSCCWFCTLNCTSLSLFSSIPSSPIQFIPQNPTKFDLSHRIYQCIHFAHSWRTRRNANSRIHLQRMEMLRVESWRWLEGEGAVALNLLTLLCTTNEKCKQLFTRAAFIFWAAPTPFRIPSCSPTAACHLSSIVLLLAPSIDNNGTGSGCVTGCCTLQQNQLPIPMIIPSQIERAWKILTSYPYSAIR